MLLFRKKDTIVVKYLVYVFPLEQTPTPHYTHLFEITGVFNVMKPKTSVCIVADHVKWNSGESSTNPLCSQVSEDKKTQHINELSAI